MKAFRPIMRKTTKPETNTRHFETRQSVKKNPSQPDSNFKDKLFHKNNEMKNEIFTHSVFSSLMKPSPRFFSISSKTGIDPGNLSFNWQSSIELLRTDLIPNLQEYDKCLARFARCMLMLFTHIEKHKDDWDKDTIDKLAHEVYRWNYSRETVRPWLIESVSEYAKEYKNAINAVDVVLNKLLSETRKIWPGVIEEKKPITKKTVVEGSLNDDFDDRLITPPSPSKNNSRQSSDDDSDDNIPPGFGGSEGSSSDADGSGSSSSDTTDPHVDHYHAIKKILSENVNALFNKANYLRNSLDLMREIGVTMTTKFNI